MKKLSHNLYKLPISPSSTYKEKWIGWRGFLGDGYIISRKKKYLSYEGVRKFAVKLGFKNQKEWYIYCKQEKTPDGIPASPSYVYKDCGWISWGEFLGTGTIASYNKEYLPFKQLRDFARRLKLKSRPEWDKYCQSDKRPKNIPSRPDNVYKRKGWKSWGDFLGTKNICTRYKKR